jgi:predicted N-acetyltransferase YhbS
MLESIDQKDAGRVIEETAASGCRSLAGWPGMVLHEDPDLEWTSSEVPFQMFNNIFRLHTAPDKAAASVERIVEQAAERGVPLMWWAMEPGPELYPLLRIYGFEKAGEVRGMAADIEDLDLEATEHVGLTMREVETMEDLEAWNAVTTSQFGFPHFAARANLEMYAHVGVGSGSPWRQFIAVDEQGAVVAVSSLFSGPEAAMIGGVAVVPERRNRGLGRAMTALVAKEAERSGYRVAVVLSGPEAERMYARMGFRTCSQGEMYFWEGFADTSQYDAEHGESFTVAPSKIQTEDLTESERSIQGGSMNEQDRNNTQQTGDPDSEPRLDLSFTRSTREIAAAALVGAIIAVVTLVVIFFAFRQDVTNYGKQIEALDNKLTERVNGLRSDMDKRVTALEERIDNIKNLPEQVRRQILMDTVREMGARVDFLRSQAKDGQLKEKLDGLESSLNEVEKSLSAD